MHIPTTCPCGWKASHPSEYLDHSCNVVRQLHPEWFKANMKNYCGWHSDDACKLCLVCTRMNDPIARHADHILMGVFGIIILAMILGIIWFK